MTAATGSTQERLFTGGFSSWLGASSFAAVGDGICYFAIGWTAADLGGSVAGLIMTLIVAPRAILLLVGGAAADRWGLRRTIIGCDAATCLALLAYLGLSRTPAATAALLAALALSIGVVSAFRMPAAGAFPRLFASDDMLPRAMAVTSSVLQAARLIGPALGGVVVAAFGMSGAVSANLAGFALVLLVLLAIRPPYERFAEDAGETSTLGSIRSCLHHARTLPGIPSLLTSVALVACGLIPMVSLWVPLAAHERGWAAGTTGLIEAAWVTGTLGVTLAVARFGTRSRSIGAMIVGPLLAASAVATIAFTPTPYIAMAASFVMGIGTAIFTTHSFPLYILRAPDGMYARFQALAGVVQSAPMLVTNNLLGAVAQYAGVTWAMVVVAAVTALAGAVVAFDPALRRA